MALPFGRTTFARPGYGLNLNREDKAAVDALEGIVPALPASKVGKAFHVL